MNLIKKSLLTLTMAISLSASTFALAEDAATTATIAHLEGALVEVGKKDFNASNIHLKAARDTAEKITDNKAIVKNGVQSIIQAQIQGKQADIEKTTAELNKALEAFKSIK